MAAPAIARNTRVPIASRALVGLLVLALAGCSLGDEEQPSDPTKRKPLKVQHALGETRVPFLSDRPVTLDPAALETALALGAAPLGSASFSTDGRFPTYLGDAVAGVEQLGPVDTPDVAHVQRLEPDVIIASERYQRPLYDRLSEIAATVMGGVPLSEWKSDVRFFGEALGRSRGGERLLIDWDRRVAHTRRVLADTRVERVELGPELARALDPDFVASVLRDVGLPPSAARPSGRGGGIIAARRVLLAVERSARSPRTAGAGG
jgi:ABC-type Fe3+-hydroxamate transport system substrate-binding protein